MFLEIAQQQLRYADADRPAVDAILFGLQTGDIGVLIGPAAYHKTTLLRAVAGFDRAA